MIAADAAKAAKSDTHGTGPGSRTAACACGNLTRTQKIVSWIAQAAGAGIFLQTLFFKFSGAEESIYIFKTLGMEPWGRYGSGAAELVASVLLLTPRFASVGAALGLGIISGAIISHLTKLGIVVKDDGGLLFGLAVAVFVACAVVLAIRYEQLPILGPIIKKALGR